MKIAVVCRGCGEATSVPSVALNQAKALARWADVTLFSEAFPTDPPCGFRCVPLRPAGFTALGRFSHVPRELAFATAALGELLRAASDTGRTLPDVVFAHGHVPAAIVSRPLRDLAGVPTVVVAHGEIFDRPKGTYDARLTALYKWATAAAYRAVDGVAAISPWMAEAAFRGGAPRCLIRLIPNGVSREEIGLGEDVAREADLEPQRGVLKVVYVGRLSVEKGVRTLIQACRSLGDMGHRVEVRLVGAGPEESGLRNLVAALGLAGAVTFAGPLPRMRLGEVYRSSDVACVPSCSEPFGLVAAEALVAGTPVVASRVGGLPFIVRDGIDGLLVPPGDAGSLARALASLVCDRERLARLRRGARASADRFSWDSCGRELAGFAEEVMRRAA